MATKKKSSSSSSTTLPSSSTQTTCPTPPSTTNFVSRTVFVDPTYGTCDGQFENPDAPFLYINDAMACAIANATKTNPVQVLLRPGVYKTHATVQLSDNVTVQGSGIESTIVYGRFSGSNLAAGGASSMNSFSLVSYYGTAYCHDSDGQVTMERMKIYQLNTVFPCGDPRMRRHLLQPNLVTTSTAAAINIHRGSFTITNSNIEMDSPNPGGNTDTSVYKIADDGPVFVNIERTNTLHRLNNTSSTSTNRFISVIYYASNAGNQMTIRSSNGIHQIYVADTSDPNATILFSHAVNTVTSPKVEFIGNNDRFEIDPQNLFVATVTTPIQAVTRIDDFAGSYLSNFYFRNNLTVPTIKYLSNDEINKYTVISNSTLSRTFLHHISAVNVDKVPPVLGSNAKTYIIGAEAEGENLRNGAYVTTVRLVTAALGNPYNVQPQDYAITVDVGTPAETIQLPAITDQLRSRTLRITNLSVNPVTILPAAGQPILFNSVIVTSITLTQGQIIELASPGDFSTYFWTAIPINF